MIDVGVRYNYKNVSPLSPETVACLIHLCIDSSCHRFNKTPHSVIMFWRLRGSTDEPALSCSALLLVLFVVIVMCNLPIGQFHQDIKVWFL